MTFNIREQVPQLFIGGTMQPAEASSRIEERHTGGVAFQSDLSQGDEVQEDDNDMIYDKDIPFYDRS